MRSFLLFLSICLLPLSASAEWSGFGELSSDYIWRGRSETRHRPAWQGEADYADGPFYAGMWFSRVDFGDGVTPVELDPYVGAVADLDIVQLVLGLGATVYPVQPHHTDMNDEEGKIGLTKHLGDVQLSVAANERIHGGRGHYYEAAGAYDFDRHWKVSLALGEHLGAETYMQGTAALNYAVDERWGLALAYANASGQQSLAFSLKFTL